MTTPPSARGFNGDVHVALVTPEIHWNTGNIGRTCLALGARLHLVEPLGFSLGEREVRRAGLDYWDRVEVTVWPSLVDFEAALPGLGEPFLFSAEASRSYWDVPYPRPVTLIFGSESCGIPGEMRERYASRLVRVPMRPGSVRSLNLSTAAALALFEVFRQGREIV